MPTADCTTVTSPGPGAGTSTSCMAMTSGPPVWANSARMAFMALLLNGLDASLKSAVLAVRNGLILRQALRPKRAGRSGNRLQPSAIAFQ